MRKLGILLDSIWKKKSTASVAKERLQIILAYERSTLNLGEINHAPERGLPDLQKRISSSSCQTLKIDQDAQSSFGKPIVIIGAIGN